MKERLSQGFNHLFNGAKLFIHPFMPSIKIVFKKYLGKYFKESLQLDQMAGMGMRNLNLNIKAVNESLNPAIPFIVQEGSIGQIKLDLKQLTVILDKIDITLTFKTPEQLLEFGRNYQRMTINAQNLEKLKEDCIKSLMSSQNRSAHQKTAENAADLSWGVLKQILSKVKISVTNICVRLVVPLEKTTHLTFLISGCQLRMRKITMDNQVIPQPDDESPKIQKKTSNKSLTSTLILGGISLHLNQGQPIQNVYDPMNFQEETCILSLCNQYNNKQQLESHLIIHLKVDVKERLKFSSSLQMKQLELNFNRQQLVLFNQIILKSIELQSALVKKDDEKKQKMPDIPGFHKASSQLIDTEKIRDFKWSSSTLIPNYMQQNGQEIYIQQNPLENAVCENDQSFKESICEEQIQMEDFKLNTSIDQDNYHLENISCAQSEFNGSTCAIEQSWAESSISGSQQQIDSSVTNLGQPSFYQYSVNQRNLSIDHEEKRLVDLHSGNLILSFSLDLLLISVRHNDHKLTNKNDKWIYSFVSQKTLKKKDNTDIFDILNPSVHKDHLIFAVQSFSIKMQKQTSENLVESGEPKIIKVTQIIFHQINLLDVRAHVFQRQHEDEVKQQQNSPIQIEAEEDLLDNDNLSIDSYHSNISFSDAMRESYENSRSECFQTPSQIVRIVEKDQEYTQQLLKTKNDHFISNRCNYFTVQNILSISPPQSQINNRELIKCLRLRDDLMIFLLQPDQRDIQLKIQKEPAISIKIKPKDADDGQLQVVVQICDINLLASIQSLTIIKGLFESTLQNFQFKVNKQKQPHIDPNSNQMTVFIDIRKALEITLLLQDLNLIDLYFIQAVHSKLIHQNDSAFRYQLQKDLQCFAFNSIKIRFQQIFCQYQTSEFKVAFEQLKVSQSSLDLQCIQFNSLQFLHQDLFQIVSKDLDNQISSEIKIQYTQAILKSLIKIYKIGDKTQICLTFPHTDIFIEGSLSQQALNITNFFKDLFTVGVVQEHKNEIIKPNFQIDLFFDEVKIICLDGQPKLLFLDHDNQVKIDKQSHQPQFVQNQLQQFSERMGIHISKMHNRFTIMDQAKSINLAIYNFVVWDSLVSADHDTIQYGSFPQTPKSCIQTLKFRNSSYDAQSVIVYKQERSNREKFKNLITNEAIFDEIDSASLTISQTDDLLNPLVIDRLHLYIHPDNILNFQENYQASCILLFNVNPQNVISVDLQHAIIACDQHIQNMIPYIQRLGRSLRPPKTSKQDKKVNDLKVQINVNNLWLSVFPSYNRQALLQQFVKTQCKCTNLQPYPTTYNQQYYSWTRSIFVISESFISVEKQAKQIIKITANIRKLKYFLKNTSCPDLQFSNPVLLIQPEMTIYRRNRKISDAFQIDNDQQALLKMFNFQKIGTFYDLLTQVEITQQKQIKLSIQLQRGKFNFKKDSLNATLTLIELVDQNFQQNDNKEFKEQELPTTSLYQSVSNQTLNIFSNQNSGNTFNTDILQKVNNFELTLCVKKLEVSLYQGYHFSTEMFSILNDEDVYINVDEPTILKIPHSDSDKVINIIGYETYHLDFQEGSHCILEAEQNIDSCTKQDSVQLCLVDAEFKLEILLQGSDQTQTLTSKIQDFKILDNIKKSKFSRIFSKESLSRLNESEYQNKLMFELYFQRKSSQNDSKIIPILKIQAKVYPIRICIYGATIEFLLNQIPKKNQWETPKQQYIKQLEFSLQNCQGVADYGCPDNHEQQIRNAIQKVVLSEGFNITFPKNIHQTAIHLDQLSIDGTILTISIDGSGIQSDTLKKGMIRIASYDNLELNLKSSFLKDVDFNQQSDLLNLVLEQYIQHIKENKEFFQSLFLQFKGLQNMSQIYFGFRNMIASSFKDGILIGLSTGSVPFMKAIADEIIFLAKKPIDVCESVTEQMGLQPIADKVIRPLQVALQKIGNHLSNDLIPSEFLKK